MFQAYAYLPSSDACAPSPEITCIEAHLGTTPVGQTHKSAVGTWETSGRNYNITQGTYISQQYSIDDQEDPHESSAEIVRVLPVIPPGFLRVSVSVRYRWCQGLSFNSTFSLLPPLTGTAYTHLLRRVQETSLEADAGDSYHGGTISGPRELFYKGTSYYPPLGDQ